MAKRACENTEISELAVVNAVRVKEYGCTSHTRKTRLSKNTVVK
jgi:hypothetical protein